MSLDIRMVEYLNDQPIGTILIFESNDWPVLTKRLDGRWAFVLPGVVADPVPLNVDTIDIWVRDSDNKCWLY